MLAETRGRLFCRRQSAHFWLLTMAAVSMFGCKRIETLAFEGPSEIVIDSDAGATLPRVVGKTSAGEIIVLDKTPVFAVDPPDIVELQGEKIVPLKNGRAKVVAKLEDKQGTVEVLVRVVDEVALSCLEPPCRLKVGTDLKLDVRVTGLGAPVDTPPVWASSLAEVATVDKGVVRGLSAGKAVISADVGAKKGTIDVEVRALVDDLVLFCPWPPIALLATSGTVKSVNDVSCEGAVGESTKLYVEARSKGVPLTDEHYDWQSSDPSVVVVDGNLSFMRVGGGVVSVRSQATSAELPVSVSPKKRGAPVCVNNAGGNLEVTATAKATVAGEDFTESHTLGCQDDKAAQCTTEAYAAFGQAASMLPDMATVKRVVAHFRDQTARRCCCLVH